MKKTHVGFICGGKSSEHEISLLSVKNIVDALNRELFDATLFGVDKHGVWRVYPLDRYLEDANDPKKIRLAPSDAVVAFIPGENGANLVDARTLRPIPCPEVMFPIIHGTYGEDGSLQGFLNILGIPFVGAGVLSSAVCMDKDVCKRLLQQAGIRTAPNLVFTASTRQNYDQVRKALGSTVFVKPANQGSSVGVSKAVDARSFEEAVQNAFQYDVKVLVEAAISGREIECSVLGPSEAPMVSGCGEVVVADTFYSYEAKYIEDTARVIIPADLDADVEAAVRETAAKAYQALGCTGFARIDFFVSGRDVYVNELNTLPGFTNISMYPKLWEEAGIGYSKLITRLIRSALKTGE